MNPTDLKNIFQDLRTEANKVLVGLEEPFELLAVALFTGGHVLLEGVPGTAKTLMAKTLAHMVRAQFTRIQFTPDLMPSDILGTSVFDVSTTRFYLKKGPIFTQLLLADEINRRACQDPVGSFGGDGGATDQSRRREARPGSAIYGGRHPESNRI